MLALNDTIKRSWRNMLFLRKVNIVISTIITCQQSDKNEYMELKLIFDIMSF